VPSMKRYLTMRECGWLMKVAKEAKTKGWTFLSTLGPTDTKTE